jgi:hypothetical protein
VSSLFNLPISNPLFSFLTLFGNILSGRGDNVPESNSQAVYRACEAKALDSAEVHQKECVKDLESFRNEALL